MMNNKTFLAGFCGFALIALASMTLLFQNSTLTANIIHVPTYETTLSKERILSSEPCITVTAELGLEQTGCNALGQYRCRKAYHLEGNFEEQDNKGDVHAYPLHCINECLRDVRAQCKYAFGATNRPSH